MTTYRGQLNVIKDGDGSVIPITLSPGDIPSEGLVIDVTNLQQAAGLSAPFGYISGLTVDANNANIAAGLVSIFFGGGSNLTRNANGGNTQVYRVSGPCLQITIKNLAWVSGTINFILWNTAPNNELQSPLNVIASGAVTISGTPTVQFAAGQTVGISAGSITFTNSQINVEHLSHSIATGSSGIAGASTFALLTGGNGTIRSIFIGITDLIYCGPEVVLPLLLSNNPGSQTYWIGSVGLTNTKQGAFTVVELSMLGIPFTTGVSLSWTRPSRNLFIDQEATINATIGYN